MVAQTGTAHPDAPSKLRWTPEQLRAFVQHVADGRLHAAWLRFATTGMRRGEVTGLTWDAVDLDTFDTCSHVLPDLDEAVATTLVSAILGL